jgi:ribonucleoside-triphosphate reductase (thioredoxin)
MHKYLPTTYQQYIHLSRYSRFNWELNRRETWEETVERYISFFVSHIETNNSHTLTPKIVDEIRQSILTLNVMPSMRCLMSAGPSLARDNVAGYNCSYVAIDRVQTFDEILYILMCGTGVGFSVERQFINKLPTIAEDFYNTDTVIKVSDSKIGWAKAFKELVALLYQGQIPNYDTSKLRPAGAVLKTSGGRSSGPEPFEDLIQFTINLFKSAAGRKLNSIECHDLVCKIADVIVVGGVRRSALISLSNLSDDRMRNAKSGKWWENNNQRNLANISTSYTEKPDIGIFMEEWLSLYNSKSGERGIFNRHGVKSHLERVVPNRDRGHEFGTNPCGEIILRDREFCNLTEIVVKSTDTEEDLLYKAKIATIIGTMQATLTNFRYLSKKWQENCEDERLLGVSLTGVLDNSLTNNSNKEATVKLLKKLYKVVKETNDIWSLIFDIKPAAALTCNKPSGTVSQLVDSASGVHARHAKYFIRTIRADKHDPLAKFMIDQGFVVEDDVTKPNYVYVFSFPMKPPSGSIFRTDLTALDQLEIWKCYKENWTDHNPSVTITVKEHEWIEVGAWVYKNFDSIGGLSFLPYSDHVYRQAPYQDCSEKEYLALLNRMPKDVDWSGLSDYENTDLTEGAKELSCSAGVCEI